jgi:sec-independent protein translocase protein TatA
VPFGLQPTHLILILVVALLVFGPSRLPEIGRSFGTMFREFKGATKAVTEGFQDEPRPAAKLEEPKPAPKNEEPAPIPCTSCSKPIQSGAKFCPDCGAAQ